MEFSVFAVPAATSTRPSPKQLFLCRFPVDRHLPKLLLQAHIPYQYHNPDLKVVKQAGSHL
jgi:hypothetical protein